MAASMTFILAPYAAIDHIIVRSMVGRGAHGLDVSFGGEDPHTFCRTCSNGSMRDDVATIVQNFIHHEVSHEVELIPYDDVFQLITYEMIWASLIYNIGGEIFGDLVFILPLEGNIIAAQDQKIIHTYQKWRGGHRGVGYFVYHDQIFSPPTLQEPKVEEDFQELPCWEVTHFVWMIAWEWRIHLGKMFLNTFQTPCLEWIFSNSILAVA